MSLVFGLGLGTISRADDPAQSEGGSRQALALSTTTAAQRLIALEEAGRIGSRDAWSVGTLDPDHDDYYVYRLPYDDDVSYAVLQGYGSKLSHQGSEYFTVDFRMPEGTRIHAAREGTVVLV